MWYKAKLKGPQVLSSQKKKLLDELWFDFTNQQQKNEASLLSNCTPAPKQKNTSNCKQDIGEDRGFRHVVVVRGSRFSLPI
jgi:hypothetical protein